MNVDHTELSFTLRRSIQIARDGTAAIESFYRANGTRDIETLARACEAAAKIVEDEYLKTDLIKAAERLREL